MIERETYTVEEAAKVLGISKPSMYAAVKRGEIPVIKIGRVIRVPKAAMSHWLAGIRPESHHREEVQ